MKSADSRPLGSPFSFPAMLAFTPHVPTDYAPEERVSLRRFPDVARALVGAVVTLSRAIAALHQAVRLAVAVVQPALSGWLQLARRLCRFSR